MKRNIFTIENAFSDPGILPRETWETWLREVFSVQGIGVRERKWEMAERVHRTQIGLLRPNANPNVFVPEKEIVPEKLYQKKNCTIKSGR